MPSYTSMAAAFVALVQLAAATPVTKRSAFTVNQVEVGRAPRLGAVEVAKTYKKFKVPVPDHIQAAAAAAVTGTVAADPAQYDLQYLEEVTIGGQTFHLDFDTGSSDLWVFSTLTPENETNGQDLYDPSKSSTAKQLSGATWSIEYADQSSSGGVVYTDTVVVGGVVAPAQAVEVATTVSAEFTNDTSTDGLLGLAFSSMNTVKPNRQNTFFDNVKASLAKALFAVTLKHNAPGTYDFGFIDPSKYTGDITYTPVTTSFETLFQLEFWSFSADGVSVGGKSIGGSFSPIADTGTTLLYLSSSVVKSYYSQVQGAHNNDTLGGYIFPCDAQLPDLTITIAGSAQVVPAVHLNYAPNGDGTCFGGLQPTPQAGTYILGDVFLKSNYVVFDYQTSSPRLGFASQA